MTWLKLSDPPSRMARSELLLRGAIAALERGEGQVAKLFHTRVFSSKDHASSEGQGPPPVPPLHAHMYVQARETLVLSLKTVTKRAYYIIIVHTHVLMCEDSIQGVVRVHFMIYNNSSTSQPYTMDPLIKWIDISWFLMKSVNKCFVCPGEQDTG